jgi:hemolysin activation/secretion protein
MRSVRVVMRAAVSAAVFVGTSLPAWGQAPPPGAGQGSPPPENPQAAPARSAAAASNPAFNIFEFQVEGNSALPVREIERAVMPFLGEKRHFSDVEGARKALEQAYQKAGFQTVFVDIPEQRITGGVIRLHVLEGSVGQLRVTGTRYFEPNEIRGGVTELASGTVPDFTVMQQQLADLNKSSDRQVAPILTPGRVPGTVDVNLSVKETLPLHGDIEDDNHASPFTTADRASASLHYDNLWQRQHSLALNYQVSPQKPSEANVVYGTYLWRFSGSDNVLSLYAIRSNSNVAVVGSATILGNAKIAGARYIVPVASGVSGDDSYFHSLTLGVDRKDFAQTNISAQSADLTVLPPISYFPLSLNYSATLVDAKRTDQFSFGLVTAPRGILGNSDAKFQSRRVLGNASFVAWKFDGSVDATITPHWGAYGHVEGQWTYDALIPNEQYVTGGADSVRGYRESEISGDRGAHATLEARYFPLGHPGSASEHSLYVCAFADAAQVRLVDPAGPQIALISIASDGFGVHGQGWRGVHFAFDLAEALRNGGHAVNGYITEKGTKRLEASVGYSF